MTECERLPFVPDSPDDDLVLLHQFHVSETYALHCHTFYEVFYVLRGQAIHEINDATQILSEGMLLFIRPDDRHAYKYFNRDEFEFININIADSLVTQAFAWLRLPMGYFDSPQMPPSIQLVGAQHMEMRRKFLELADMPAGERRRRAFCALLPEVLLTLYGQEDAASTPYAPYWLSELLRRMDQPEMFIGGLPELLRISPYSQEHLTRCFRKYIHMTPTTYINQKRLSYAAELLTEQGMPPQQAAVEAGFHNISHFYHCFRAQYSLTPLQYSQQYSERRTNNARYLMAISRRAMHSCLAAPTKYITLKGGLFAYYMEEGCAQIYISYAQEVTQPDLNELGACWDPRLNAGATLHANRSNYELIKGLCASLHTKPVRQICEMSMPREMLSRLPLRTDYIDEGVTIRPYSDEVGEDISELIRLCAADFGHEEAVIKDCIRYCAKNGCVHLLCVQDRTVGAVWGSGEEILGVAVHPFHRHRGYGSLLAAEAARTLLASGEACTMLLPDTCTRQIDFAKAAGFVQTACEAVFELEERKVSP